MLGGLSPVIIFQFSKLANTQWGEFVGGNSLLSQIPTFVAQPPIPIYLSERLTGLFVDTENKQVDLNTETTTLKSGEDPEIDQNAIGSTVSVSLKAKKDSIALITLSSLIDMAYDKATSGEYAISYLHGVVTVFRGKLVSYSFDQIADTDLISVQLELTRGTKKPETKETVTPIQKETGTVPLDRGGNS